MKLTKEEQAMLDGEFGAGVQLAMKIQVAIGEAYDAPYMVPVSSFRDIHQKAMIR